VPPTWSTYAAVAATIAVIATTRRPGWPRTDAG
jgi:hypothetical protein